MRHSVAAHGLMSGFPFVSALLAPAALVQFLVTNELFWLRAAYWLLGMGVIVGLGAALLGLVAWLADAGAGRRTLGHGAAALLLLFVQSAAWVGLGGWASPPATVTRDVTVSVTAAFMAVPLALAGAWSGWVVAHQRRPARPAAVRELQPVEWEQAA